jgi:hypothetical protein
LPHASSPVAATLQPATASADNAFVADSPGLKSASRHRQRQTDRPTRMLARLRQRACQQKPCRLAQNATVPRAWSPWPAPSTLPRRARTPVRSHGGPGFLLVYLAPVDVASGPAYTGACGHSRTVVDNAPSKHGPCPQPHADRRASSTSTYSAGVLFRGREVVVPATPSRPRCPRPLTPY